MNFKEAIEYLWIDGDNRVKSGNDYYTIESVGSRYIPQAECICKNGEYLSLNRIYTLIDLKFEVVE
jgi:hypothetical protein